MRELIVNTFLTLDGVIAGAGRPGGGSQRRLRARRLVVRLLGRADAGGDGS